MPCPKGSWAGRSAVNTTADPGRGFLDPPDQADDNRPGGGTGNCQDPPLD
jgi:hypothetical protein